MLFNENAITPQGYNITNSLRFQRASSQYLSRTPSVAGNRTTWTMSLWVKRGVLNARQDLFGIDNSNVLSYQSAGSDGDSLTFELYNGAGANYYIRASAVHRDPSAWYHIVAVWDTTNATAADRQRLYVNGERLTAITTGNSIPLNAQSNWNSTSSHSIGRNTSGGFYFDGHMTEMHFVDGQALTPASFGRTSPASGQWVARKYTGTYGTNGFYLPFDNVVNTSSNSLTYSEDFNNAIWPKGDASTLSNVAVAPDGATTADKLVENTANTIHYLYQAQTVSNVTQFGSVYVKAAGRSIVALQFSNLVTAAAQVTINLTTQAITVGGASADYSNISGGIIPVGNDWYRVWIKATKGTVNTNNAFVIATVNSSNATYYAGDGTSGLFIWGAQVETDGTLGYYRKTTNTTLSYVSNLFADKSLGKGSVNFWTPSNFSITTGISDCRSIDVPSGNGASSGTQPASNYAVFNPIDGQNIGVQLSNLYSLPFQSRYTKSTLAIPSSGKWYAEFTIGSTQQNLIGISAMLANNANNLGYDTKQICYQWNGAIVKEGTSVGSGATLTTNDILALAVDADTKEISFYKNGTVTGVTVSYSSFGTEMFFAFGTYLNGGAAHVNFGQRSFAYTPPTGFKALCTANLPTPIISKGNVHFDATVYSGNDTARSITNAGGFEPGIVWQKNMGINFTKHYIFDAAQGVGKWMSTSDSPTNTYTDANTLTSFNSNGFSLGTGTAFDGLNCSGYQEVAWQWKAGSPVTNTAGTITTTVRANPTAGISIVSYTGTQVAATVGHGLGSAPKFIISRASPITTNFNWLVYHEAAGPTKVLYTYSTTAATVSPNPWNDTAPTSSVYSVLSGGGTNALGVSYIAYCFAEVPGFSKISSYTGNGNPDGTFVYTGFRPRYIMIKRTDDVSDWVIKDTARSESNVVKQSLYANLTWANTNTEDIDILSNGFKIRHSPSTAQLNATGGTYAYVAFAEAPFNYSNAR